MAALACILKDLGNDVIGYDDDASYKYTMEGLNKRNIKIYSTNEHYIDKDTIVTYSKAFSPEHKEMKRCKEMGLKFIEYFELMGELSKEFYTIGVSGTHGKTTVSSLLHSVLKEKANYFIGDGEGWASKNNRFMIMESCEYNKHFLHYFPSLAIITNIDRDHTECYETMDDLTNAFGEFGNRAKTVICLGDDKRIRSINFKNKAIYYGFNENNDIYAKNIIKNEKGNTFDVYYKGELFGNFHLNVPGDHNITNALASIAAAHFVGVCPADCQKGLLHFTGTERRFQKKGEKNGLQLFTTFLQLLPRIRRNGRTVYGRCSTVQPGAYSSRTPIPERSSSLMHSAKHSPMQMKSSSRISMPQGNPMTAPFPPPCLRTESQKQANPQDMSEILMPSAPIWRKTARQGIYF